MIPEVILDVILDVILEVILHAILHGFGAFGRGSILPWDRVVGFESIMSKRQPDQSRMTRYIVRNQVVKLATGTNRHVPPILRLP
jgi:hypothetical protein